MTYRMVYAAVTLAALFATGVTAQERPNVLLIMTDNQSPNLLGAYGNRDIKTPNIDQLARDGLLFAKAYATSGVCSPSRAVLMTGLIPSANGVHNGLPARYTVEDYAAIEEFRNLPQTLADAGYYTGLVGKYHLGRHEKPQLGFQWWTTFRGGHTSSFVDDPAYAEVVAGLDARLAAFFSEYAEPTFDLWNGGTGKVLVYYGRRNRKFRDAFPDWREPFVEKQTAFPTGKGDIMTESRNPLQKWLGCLLLVAAGLLTAANLYFAASPVAATPFFNYVDVLVLVGFAATIAEIIRSKGGAVPLCTFAIAAHLYAYNYIAKVSESGLENATIWLLIDPVVAALFLYKGLQYLRKS